MRSRHKVILAIETSCDETAASVCINGEICSNVIYQQKVHANFGGVVPEVASRAHLKKINQVVKDSLRQAKIKLSDLTAIAVANGPGLMGSLLVGSGFAKGLAAALDLPLLPIDHLEAHLYAHFIDKPKPDLPFACLLVSGGHTFIFCLNQRRKWTLIGKTLDDAAGEALDKCAKVMNLTYPGGPEIDKRSKKGNHLAFSFGHPKVEKFNYSFSGLKTSFMNFIRNQEKKNPNFIADNLNDLCASIQYTVVEYLLKNFRNYLISNDIRNIGIAGGVAANSYLRKALSQMGHELNAKVFVPDFAYCTDNAAMIAKAADIQYEALVTRQPNFVPYSRSPWKS